MVEFVNRVDNEWNDNADWFRKCRQRLHDKFANCKSYLEDCGRSGWDMSQGPQQNIKAWLRTSKQPAWAFEFAGRGITAHKVFKGRSKFRNYAQTPQNSLNSITSDAKE